MIISNYVYSIQEYCETFLDICPVVLGDKDELRSILDSTGHTDLLDYPMDEIDHISGNKHKVVLVDTTYENDASELVTDHRWVEVPANSNTIMEAIVNKLLDLHDISRDGARILILDAVIKVQEKYSRKFTDVVDINILNAMDTDILDILGVSAEEISKLEEEIYG